MITATRGLAQDVMSVDIDATQNLISARRAGNASRVQRYLDSNNQIFEVVYSCAISNGGKSGPGTVRMMETCQSDDRQVENTYDVTARGQIVQSSQWVGGGLGQGIVQILR